MVNQRKFIMIVAVIGMIATFLPWFSVSAGAYGFNVNRSRNGFHDAGILYFILLIVIAIIAAIGEQSKLLEKNMRLCVVGGGIVALICLFYSYGQAKDEISGGMGMVSLNMGIGFILSSIAAISVIAIPFVFKGAGESLGNDLAHLKGNLKSLQSSLPKSTPVAAHNPAKMEELEKLITWKNEGKITAEEYEVLKAKIM